MHDAKIQLKSQAPRRRSQDVLYFDFKCCTAGNFHHSRPTNSQGDRDQISTGIGEKQQMLLVTLVA